MNKKWSITDGLLYGGDYNPDQWLDRPDILEEDIRLMQKAKISVVSLGIFAWSTLEPEEGVFHFDWLDKVIDNLHTAGIKVFLATPSGARPAWLAAKYPEVLRVSASGQRNLFGARHNHCPSSPVYREKVRIINTKLAKRYTNHPAVVLWHISNEYHGVSQDYHGECHCDICQENFRQWLKKRYGSLAALNAAWWSTFWSHTITDWNQIHSPVLRGEQSVHGLNLDWKRFYTHMVVDFMKKEVAALKAAGSELPVTTNMMIMHEAADHDPGLDYWKFQDAQDIASWDSYPSWHMPGHKASAGSGDLSLPVNDFRRASEVAMQHDLFRSLHKAPFLLMESTPSKVNWKNVSKNKRPGMNILSSLQAVAHGANSVQYFQWRQGRGSFEKFHGAVIDQSGSENTAVFKDVAELGDMLQQLAPLAQSEYTASVALLFSWENRWAFDDSKGPINTERKAYVETIKNHYYCLWQQGIQVDIISGEESMEKYDLVVAPMVYMVTKPCGENLQNFVKQGGTLFTTYYTGYVNESDLCFEGGAPGPLHNVLGFHTEDIDALYGGEEMTLLMGKESYPVQDYYEIIHPTTAKVLATYTDHFSSKLPGLLQNSYKKGTAYHLAGRLDTEGLSNVYKTILGSTNVCGNSALVAEMSSKINIQIRRTEERQYLFVMNFSEHQGHVTFKESYTDALNAKSQGTDWKLPPYGVRVLVV